MIFPFYSARCVEVERDICCNRGKKQREYTFIPTSLFRDCSLIRGFNDLIINIGHRFLALVDKHFPEDHKLRKIFNRNIIKISYSHMNNTEQIIDNHNNCILNSSKHINDTADNTNTKDTKTCNCRQKNTCPLNGNCLQSSLIYQATVTRKDNSTTETYIGLTENDFKTRYRNHTASFRHTNLRNSTELSKHIWTLKENNINYYISWRILSSRSPYNSANKRCNLCLK